MNLNQLNGDWTGLKRKLQQEFGRLSDQELLQDEGQVDDVSGIIQQKYGLTEQQAEQKIEAFFKKNS